MRIAFKHPLHTPNDSVMWPWFGTVAEEPTNISVESCLVIRGSICEGPQSGIGHSENEAISPIILQGLCQWPHCPLR